MTHVEGVLEDCCLLLRASGLEFWGLGFRLVLSRAYSGYALGHNLAFQAGIEAPDPYAAASCPHGTML